MKSTDLVCECYISVSFILFCMKLSAGSEWDLLIMQFDKAVSVFLCTLCNSVIHVLVCLLSLYILNNKLSFIMMSPKYKQHEIYNNST